MKPTNILTKTFCAIAGLALLTTAAEAAPLIYNTGELLMGFRAGTAADTRDYVINIGPYTTFTGAGVGTFALSTGSIGADLTAVFGASWFSRSDLFWGIAGYENITKTNTLYATRAESPYGTIPGTPKAPGSNSAQAAPANNIDAIGGQYQLSGDSTTGSGGAAVNAKGLRQLTADVNSWAFYMQANSANPQNFTGNSFNYFPVGIEGNFGSGTGGTALDLYQIIRTGTGPAAAANDIGVFTITNAGVVSFTSPSPIPEPGSFTLLLSAVGFGLASRHRTRR